MKINIIQWNINGLVKKLNDIKLIIQHHDNHFMFTRNQSQ
jgi:hypothetical protein